MTMTPENTIVVSQAWAGLLAAQRVAYEAHKQGCPNLWIDWSESGAPEGLAHCGTCLTNFPIGPFAPAGA